MPPLVVVQGAREMDAWVTWGMFVAWLVHDAEELITMPGWAARHVPGLRQRWPRVPDRFWSRLEPSRAQVTLAVVLMGVFVLVAAADGARTGGSSTLFQAVLIGFGVHGVGHLGQSVLTRGYTPGVITAPLIVIPFSVLAWQAVDRAGVVAPGLGDALLPALVLLPVLLAGVQLLSALVLRLVPAVTASRSLLR